VERTLSSLSLREKAAQLVTVWLTGGYASTSSPEFEELAELVEVQGIGGLVISIGLPHGFAAKLNSLQARATVPLLVSSDLESGPGYRLGGVYALPTLIDMGGATEFPPAMAFGAIDEEETVFEMGRITALEARALGVHLNFAPVLDVNSNPTNPIINTRSFGEDPERVAALGAAMIRGMHAGGLMATGKHFPGHGDTSTDSHVELPIVEADRLRLDSLELVPFRRAIQAGVDAVMTAHVAVPGILGPGAPPATLSADVMTGLLRDELGFQGLLYTDALDMGAIVRGYGDAEAAVRAVQAGADVVLMPLEPVAAIEAIVAAVDSGGHRGDRGSGRLRTPERDSPGLLSATSSGEQGPGRPAPGPASGSRENSEDSRIRRTRGVRGDRGGPSRSIPVAWGGCSVSRSRANRTRRPAGRSMRDCWRRALQCNLRAPTS
jgi:beta-N-acetylhexosaminidase